MTNYNNATYLPESIGSVLNQSVSNWELLIGDDGSTDDSIEVIRPYLRDPRIRLIRNQVNRGQIQSANFLMRNACADLVGILDSDDCLAPNAIELAVEAHRAHPDTLLVYSRFTCCDEQLRPVEQGFSAPLPPGKTSLQCDCVSHFRTWKRWAGESLGGFSEDAAFAEDKDFILRIEELGPLYCINRSLYSYRVLPESQSHGRNKIVSLVSYQRAKLRAWERRQGTTLPNISYSEAVAVASYGLGLAVNGRLSGQALFFAAWLLRHPRIGAWAWQQFTEGIKGRY
jgi:glycosyltransferase involved in cell wall biosynthesis